MPTPIMQVNKATLLDILNNPNNTEEIKRLRNLKRPLQKAEVPVTSTEDALADWLGRLKLLHGVPFNYLVPDAEMLPIESIKFFYCDTIWLAYLAEGALSIGRSTTTENVLDSVFSDDLEGYTRRAMKLERSNVLGHLETHLSKHESALLTKNPIPAREKITGFLLRSGVVSGWEGLQVAAFSDIYQKQPCQLLRMDHLSPNVLFCMYEGMVKSLRINEHPEVLHFGLTPEAGNSYSKAFKYPEDKKEGSETHKAGKQIDGIDPLKITTQLLRGDDSRVIRINDLANAIKTQLATEKIGYKGPFTSAEFALEMIEGAQAVNFTIE